VFRQFTLFGIAGDSTHVRPPTTPPTSQTQISRPIPPSLNNPYIDLADIDAMRSKSIIEAPKPTSLKLKLALKHQLTFRLLLRSLPNLLIKIRPFRL
jgi:hypothetical protein